MVLVVVEVEVLEVVESVGRADSGLPKAGLQPTTASAVATNAPMALARPIMMINYRHTPNLTESARGKWVIWKSLGVLAGAVAVILLGVVGLAQITLPDVPTFEDGLEAVGEFIPTAVGARLEVTGAREGTVDLESDDASSALEDSKTKLFFSSDPLAVDQLYYDGLTFFPEPDECEFTTGRHNQDLGLVAVEMSCPELADIRDNGSISVEGRVALPAEMVVESPETGGTITVGDEEWTIESDLILTTGDVIFEPEGHPGMDLLTTDRGKWVNLAYDQESGVLIPGTLHYRGAEVDMASAGCTLQSEQVMALGPQSRIHDLTIDCDAVPLPGVGTVPLNGTVTYHEVEFVGGP